MSTPDGWPRATAAPPPPWEQPAVPGPTTPYEPPPAFGLPTSYGPGVPPAYPTPVRRAVPAALSRRDVVLLVVAVTGALVLSLVVGGFDNPLSRGLDQASRSAAYPPLPDDARYVRVGPAVQTALTGPYAWVQRDARGEPVRYDPCRPLHYVVNPAGGPPNAEKLVRDAAEVISAQTGLVLVEDGTTTERPSQQREPLQRAQYGNRWAPVLVAFAGEGGYPGLEGRVAGLGGSIAITTPQGERYVTGQVVLRGDVAQRLEDRGRTGSASAIVLHELGHVVGLAHVPDAGQLMYTDNVGQLSLGAGDVQGLSLAGQGRCFRDT
ncbi:hypothetical protein GCM10027446_28410 [Angustibacter peucedani]